MSAESLKLTVYFGERDRLGRQFLAEGLMQVFCRHRLTLGLLLRGVEGFGVKHHLHDARRLTLSEDLPLVAAAVDRPEAIVRALREVQALSFDGLMTLERARRPDAAHAGQPDASKLTVYLGRHMRVQGRPAHRVLVEIMHRHGLAAAAVMLGVDGTFDGVRHRARFFAANAEVPLMIVAVGEPGRVGAALPELVEAAPPAMITLERVRLCRREGARLADPHSPPSADARGRKLWQKLTVYADEATELHGRPQYIELIEGLRLAGARGATCLRGLWGFHGEHEPHGDSFWQLRRRVPMITELVDQPERISQLYQMVESVTENAGVVTSELVPGALATGPGIELGGLELADV